RDANLADIAYTQLLGRTTYRHRWAMPCRSLEEAIAALEGRERQRVFVGEQERSDRPVVFMFPGQGAQYVNMGRGLYENEPRFRKEVDGCSEELAAHLGLDLRSILYPVAGQEGVAAEQLRETRITQPALFVIEYALAQLWASWGLHPQAMIGHSLGEYVAATIAGVFTLVDALRLVAERGRLMQSLGAGTMLAVPLAESDLAPLMNHELSIAAVNAPGMSVISGPTVALAGFEQALKSKNIEGKRLHPSRAFHSAMMDPILEEFREAVFKANPASPTIPYISNLTGTWITAESAKDPGYWVKHLRYAVRFGDGAAELLSSSNRVFVEVGPGNTLTGLVRLQLSSSVDCPLVGSLRHPNESISDVDSLMRSLAHLWTAGAGF